MTTVIIISLIVLVVVVGVLGSRVSDLRAETRTLRSRNEWLETDIVTLRKELNSLATVVSANADRTDTLEVACQRLSPRPAPSDFLAHRYPKRADEL